MPPVPRTTAFLLSQLGSLAAGTFADLAGEAGFTPQQAGVLRLVASEPGISQRALADRLGAVPSKVVALIDELQERELVLRTRSAQDRRHHELTLTDAGKGALRALREVAERQEALLMDGLDDTERAQLHALLAKLAAERGLTPGVHPGYAARGHRRRPAGAGA